MGRIFIALALIGLTSPTLADEQSQRGAGIDCFCTDRLGNRVELGEYICMQVDGRMYMAQCQMSQNNPMWREIAPGCLSSGLSVIPSIQVAEPPLDAS